MHAPYNCNCCAAQVQPLCELGQRIAGLLSYTDTLTEDAVRYARAAAVSLVALLEAWESRAVSGSGSGSGIDGQCEGRGSSDKEFERASARSRGKSVTKPPGRQQEDSELHAIRRTLESLQKVLAG